MSETATPKTVRLRVGKCPACRDYLWADVDVAVRISGPYATPNNESVTVRASPEMVAMQLTHECRKEDDEPSNFLADLLATTPAADRAPGTAEGGWVRG